jgi:hypothetical protein
MYMKYCACLICLFVFLNPQQSSAQCALPRLVLRPNSLIGQATYDENGKPIVIIDSHYYETAPKPVRNFIFQHEAAHLMLGHVKKGDVYSGFLDPTLSREQEAEADGLAGRVINLKEGNEAIKAIADWIVSHLTRDPLHPLPKWRAEQLEDLPAKFHLYSNDDPRASSSFHVRLSYLKWHNGCPPTVSFAARFINTGNRTIQCDGMIASAVLPIRSGSADFNDPNWGVFDSRTFSLLILPEIEYDDPGQSTLMWYRDSLSVMPTLILPGEKPHLVSCRFAGGSSDSAH